LTSIASSKAAALAELTVEERVSRAKAKTSVLVDQALHLLELHEANRIIVYSPTLASQIPRSHAAHAFNTFQAATHRYEIVRLCALWDAARIHKVSIPTVVKLIDRDDVLDMLAEETRASWGTIGTRAYDQGEDEETGRLIEEAVSRSEQAHALRRTARARLRLQTAIRWSKRIEASSKLKSVRNMRDKYFAHSLERTYLEMAQEDVANMKYGDERRLLWRAVAIVDALHQGINGSGFAWKSSMEMARRNAQALWGACTFDIKR